MKDIVDFIPILLASYVLKGMDPLYTQLVPRIVLEYIINLIMYKVDLYRFVGRRC